MSEAFEMLKLSIIKNVNFDMDKHMKDTQQEIDGRFEQYKLKALADYRTNFFKTQMEKKLNSKIEDLFSNVKVIFWEEFNNFF